MEFKTWQEAHEYAQAQANRHGRTYGIERFVLFGGYWLVSALPSKAHRTGRELRCEVVEPMERNPQ